MVKSLLRGHPIIFEDEEWLYEDTRTPTAGNERECGYCGRERTKDGHDGCLGTLSGIMNACCGHGVANEAYIQFNSKNCISRSAALREIMKIKNNIQ